MNDNSKLFTYNIGGKIWIQRPLDLLQYDQLTRLMKDIPMPQTFDAAGVIAALGPKIYIALAIVLTPEGMHADDKSLAKVEEDLYGHIKLPTVQQVIADFFELGPAESLFDRLTEMLQHVQVLIKLARTNSDASQFENILSLVNDGLRRCKN